jgi:hypothetical protein
VRVEVTGNGLASADPEATADFLHAWLGWTEGEAATRGGGAADGSPEDLPDGGTPDAHAAGTSQGAPAAAPGSRVLHSVPGHAGLAVVPRGPDAAEPAVGATLTWGDLESLRESLVSAVGSGGRLVAGEPADVEADGAELVCPGDARLRVRAEAGGAPGA